MQVGKKDNKGQLLILGGRNANLWMIKDGLYAIGSDTTRSEEDAIKLYNLYNETALPLDYIYKTFWPWYEKQFIHIVDVPSRTKPGTSYEVRKGPNGELTCECPGFLYRGKCWHVDAVKELLDEQTTDKD